MAGEQTVVWSDSPVTVRVVVNCIDSSGSHVALVVDTATTRLGGYSAVPTVTPIGTGIAEIAFASISGLTEGQTIVCKVNGTAGGTAFSEYGIPVKVVADTGVQARETWLKDISLFPLLGSYTAGHKLVDVETAVTTNIPANIAALNDFDPAADTVANVTTVASVTNAVTTDTASRDASKADVSALATAASIAALNNFDPTTDTVANVTTVGSVTNAVTTDTASRDASKADVSALATAASIAALNDFDPATDTVANVTTVGSVTNPVATDSASRTASQADVSALATALDLSVVDSNVGAIKAKTDQLAFTVANQVDANALTGGGGDDAATIYSYFTSGSNEDAFKADVSGLSTFDASVDQVVVGSNLDKNGYELSAAGNDAIGSAFLAYTLTKGAPNTIERAFWQSLKATALTEGQLSGTPTSLAFDTNLTATSTAFDHLLLVFVSGSLSGEARPIESYSSTNGRIVLQEALSGVPQSGDEFLIVNSHVHPIAEIQDGLVTIGDQFTYTNQAGDSHQVTIS